MQRKKIGILTLHHHENDGSVMQAYCLQQLLQETIPEAEISILDIYPTGHAINTKQILKHLFTGRISPVTAFRRIRRLLSFQSFYRRRYQHNAPALVTNDSGIVVAHIEKLGLHAVVVGSDTLWELSNRWSGLPAPPNFYFLPGLDPKIKKIAYAISADPLPAAIPDDVNVDAVKKAVEAFDHISLRDDSTREFLISIGIDPSRLEYMPDPTIAFDFPDQVPITLLPTNKEKTACLAITDPIRRRAIADSLKKAGFQVANMIGDLAQADWDSAGNLGVEQRLGVYKSAEFLVTGRFHSSIFTLKLNACRTPVIVIEDEEKWPTPNSKCRDLFRRLGIEKFVMRPADTAITAEEILELKDQWDSSVSAAALKKLEELAAYEREQLSKIRDLVLA